MGLDVFLYYSHDWDMSIKNQTDYFNAYDILYDEIHSKYNLAPEQSLYHDSPEAFEEMEKETAELKAQYGIDEYNPETIKNIVFPDPEYPDHLFKIGYFRSSYNESGINHILADRIGITLGDIFLDNTIDTDDGYLRIDWQESLSSVNDAIEAFSQYLAKDISKYYVIRAHTRNPFITSSALDENGNQIVAYADSEQQALTLFEKQLDTNNLPFEGTAYSNLLGEWFPEGVKVHALIKGTSSMGQCIFAIAKEEENDNGWLASYKEALEIVKHTCEYILDRPDPENYRLVWSG